MYDMIDNMVNIINRQNIKQMQSEEQKLPVLFFLLQHHKFNQLIKAMLNETVSNNMLAEGGYQHQQYSNLQKFKMNQAVGRYNIQQFILLKGSSSQIVKNYQNKPLQEIIRKKILVQIPNQQTRKMLWPQFTEIYKNKQFYNQLKQLQLPTQFQINILKDINRTYKQKQVKEKTQEVLSVFAQYNPYIGYCQGMNSVIAFLIDDGFTCQQSFFIFKRISQILLPCQYYCSMDSIMAYMRIFYEMLAFTHPQCYARMKKISKQMDNSFMAMVSFVLQWFVCLYCNQNISIEITRTIWDFFLVQGISILFKAGLGMFDLLQPYILQCNSFQQYSIMQKKYIKSITNASHIRDRIIKTYISPKILNLLKQRLTQQDEKNKKKTQPKKMNYVMDKKKCDRKWNACFQKIQQNLHNNYSYDIFVYKPKQQVNIIDNYLQKMDKYYFNNVQKAQNKTDDLMVGRIVHTCQPDEELLTEDSISQKNPQSTKQKTKAYRKMMADPTSPIRLDQQMLRKKAIIKVEEVMKKKTGMERSQSMIFMKQMVQNVSLSNLLQLYEIDQMFQ